jgi:membrane fusion protein (multidrug efflux system)
LRSYLLAIATLAACTHDNHKASHPPPAKVGVVTVEKRDVPLYIEAVGSLDGYVNADIRARVKGYLEGQRYKDGSMVKAGQPLFTIEPTDYQAAARASAAGLARAKNQLAHNRTDLSRDIGLRKAGVIAQQDVDNATTAVADAEAQVQAAEAQLEQAQLNLSYTKVESPIDGIAGIALVRTGNLVGQDGPTLLTTVSQLDPIRVNFPLDEIDYVRYPERFANLEKRDLAWTKHELARLEALGPRGKDEPDAIEVVLSDGSVYPHPGAIVAVDRQIDARTGTMQLQALLANHDRVLRPGEYARVRLRRANEGHDVVVVPERALISVQGMYSVAVVGADHKVSIRRIEVGPSSQGERVVTKGLAGGEQIVVDGLQHVTDGAIVEPHPAAPQRT